MLKIKDLSWTAPDGKQVLKNITINIPDSSLIAISGPNGSGKTTLARILMGFIRPTSGKIFFNDIDITDKDVTERARLGISFGFQQPVNFKGITVKRLLTLASGRPVTESNICMLLQQVGLCAKNYINRDIDSTLSGGEIKRIEIASVLARKSSLTILDEPEAGIDLWSFEKLIDVFEEIRNRKDQSLVIISHQERILRIADEIIILEDGKILNHGPGPEMMSRMLRKDCGNANCCGAREVSYHEERN